jgi:hypothetical protein
MQKVQLALPQLRFVVATRAALGIGVGLLLADKIPAGRRLKLARVLLAAGVLSTIRRPVWYLGAS